MSKSAKTLARMLSGSSDANIRFVDLCGLLKSLGFSERTRGRHHIFWKEGIPEILNLQPRDGKSKPYQVKQVREFLVANELAGKPDSEPGDNEGQEPKAPENS